LNHRKIY
ncbi:hypothetical protein ECEC96038_0237, partial [Escherichia coli EC96038]